MLSCLSKSLLIFLFLNFAYLGHGQSELDFSLFNKLNTPVQKTSVSEEFAQNLKNNGSEIQIVTTSLFFIYKEFFSSQDFNNCSFHPSCSVYSIECIKHHGVVKGGIMTMDRLTRCHGFSATRYEKDYERRLLIDKVPE